MDDRPRRQVAAASYLPGKYIYRNPLRRPGLTISRKRLIREFKQNNPQELGSQVWIKHLTNFMQRQDPEVLEEDVHRWVSSHEWIQEEANMGPGTPAAHSKRVVVTPSVAAASTSVQAAGSVKGKRQPVEQVAAPKPSRRPKRLDEPEPPRARRAGAGARVQFSC